MVGTSLNAGILKCLEQLQHAPAPEITKEAHYLKRIFSNIASLMVQLLMTAADIAIGVKVASHVSDRAGLAVPAASAAIAGWVNQEVSVRRRNND